MDSDQGLAFQDQVVSKGGDMKLNVMHELQRRNPLIAKPIRVIQVVNQVGDGSEENPVQFEYSYFSMDGQKLATTFCNVSPEGEQSSV
ncbi:hypothetical protein [Liquorilactobacillus nagelii]|jgi:hypothetical protein|uniref:hypothetical protein n=1 Tax=Liquorilactobacillus nagelii TaxID=82688 RepID=UPI0039ECFE3A